MIVKKVDTLFHGTKALSNLISIIKNGFFPSYTNEKILEQTCKIAMISFSNIPLIEARNQVSYGDYFIGLKRNWGIEKKLHPVSYTYENSQYENDLKNLTKESSLMKHWMPIREFWKPPGITIKEESLDENMNRLLNHESLSDETRLLLEKYFLSLNSRIVNMQLYLKHYVAFDNNNVQRYAYNDREWRYIPSEIEPKIIKENDSTHAEIYKKYEKKSKPHFRINPLTFELNDLKFIIVKEKEEIGKIFTQLNARFGKEKVLKSIIKGNLTVLCMDNIWNDL